MQNLRGYKTLIDLFNSARSKYPKNIAIHFINEEEQERLTYKELDYFATRITTCLQRRGTLDNVIGVFSRQSPKLIALLLGILKIPAAFAPVGLEWPSKMAADFVKSLHSVIQAVVVQNELVENFNNIVQLLNANTKVRFARVEDKFLATFGFAVFVNTDECTVGFVQNLAYVMQTSGTTGSPKTVQVPHKCIVPNVTSLASIFNVSTEDCVALISPYTFDPFIVQLFIALVTGASIAIIPEYIQTQPNKLCKLLFDQLDTTILQPTPSLVYTMGHKQITTRLLGQNSTLKVLAFGGEPCPTKQMLREWKHPNCKTQIFNLYGITEVSSWASCYKITDEDFEAGSDDDSCDNEELKEILNNAVPLGIALDDTVIEVRDDNGSVIKKGIGTIYIGGVKRVCYIDKETDPEIMRTTGDLGYIHSGQIWYYGRHNRQIKRMGKRMNLEWIEQTLSLAHPEYIFTCAAESQSSVILQDKIHLFVKPALLQEDSSQHIESLKQTLQERLPLYAHPDSIYIIDNIPTTSHGKVDNRRLVDNHCSRNRINPNIPVREFLMKTWLYCTHQKENSFSLQSKVENDKVLENDGFKSQRENCLTKRSVCVDDTASFVESGGTSVDAVRMAGEVETWLSVQVSSQLDLSELLQLILNGTFASLCQYIETKISDLTNTTNVAETSTSCRSMFSVSQDDKHVTSEDSSQNKFATSSVLSSQTHDCGNDDLKTETSISFSSETASTVLSPPKKRTKKELHLSTDTNSCICSIQRGMKLTRCPFHQNYKEDIVFLEQQSSRRISSDQVKVKVETHWKVNFYKCIDASPFLVGLDDNAVVYLGSHAHIFKAVSLSGGKVLWETRVGDRIESSAAISQCGSFVIVGCYDGKVYVFHRHNGSISWTFQTSGPVKSSPCVDPSTGLVWIGSHDHHLYSLDLKTRTCKASIHCGGSCFSSPQVLSSHQLVFIATLTGRLFAVCTSSMTTAWTCQCPKPIFASPLVTPQGVVCACVDGLVYAYSLKGEMQWKYKTTGPIFSSPSIYTSYVVFGCHDKNVYCITDRGQLKWQFTADSDVYATPCVAQLNSGESDVIFNDSHNLSNINNQQGNHSWETGCLKSVVWVCSTKGTLYCLFLDNGHPLMTWSLPGPVFSSPVVLGNKILIGCRDDYLYCLDIKPTIDV